MKLGQKVKVRFVDEFTYTLDVEVTAILPLNKFIGRVERISSDRSEVTGGNVRALIGQEKTFRNEDIVSTAH
jgi:hypothetical protein